MFLSFVVNKLLLYLKSFDLQDWKMYCDHLCLGVTYETWSCLSRASAQLLLANSAAELI